MLAGELLVETLVAEGVRQAFTVPGESFLAVLEGLRDRTSVIKTTGCRQEAGCAFAAAAYARLSGRPAAIIVSRGPGAANAAIGIQAAWQESLPMIICLGDVPTASRGREAFQEINAETFFASIAKAVLRPEQPEDVARAAREACRLSRSGRPGPVVISLARDVTDAEVENTNDLNIAAPAPANDGSAPPAPEHLFTAARLIQSANHPILLAGELLRSEDDVRQLVRLAERCGAPVMTCYRQQDHFPNDHPAYAGHLDIDRTDEQKAAWEICDLVIAVGARLDGITTEDFRLLDAPGREWISIHPDPAATSLPAGHIGLAGSPATVVETLLEHVLLDEKLEKRVWRDRQHRAYQSHRAPGRGEAKGAVDLSAVAAATRELAGEDAVIVTDAGSFARWVHLFTPFTLSSTQAGPMSGAMGFSVPGALGAALARPDIPVVAFAGDAGFLMTAAELATCRDEALPIVIVVCDNGVHGSIKASQVRRFGTERAFAVDLDQPDMAALARSFGLSVWTVVATDDYPAALKQALAAKAPALIHVTVDPEDISPAAGRFKGDGPDAV